jgi:hypothetical protein
MRTSGVTDNVVGMHPNDHLCRPFDDFAEFARARGQRACYVARGDDLATHLESEPVPAEALRDGRAEVAGPESRHHALTPEEQVDATRLRFIDHHGLLALHGYARSNAATLVLRSQRSSLPRLVSRDVECVR